MKTDDLIEKMLAEAARSEAHGTLEACGYLRMAADRLREITTTLEYVARWSATKPDLSDHEARRVIAGHPNIKAIVIRWMEAHSSLHPGVTPHWFDKRFCPSVITAPPASSELREDPHQPPLHRWRHKP